LICWAAWAGYSASGAADTRSTSSRVFLVIQFFVLFGGIFFVFGPGLTNATQYGGAGPAANVMGLLFFFSTALGIYAHFTDSNSHLLGWFVLAVIELLGLLGMLPALSLGVPIMELNQGACLVYFQVSSLLDRCDNEGFLQLLRTWGLFLIFALAVGITNTIHRVQFTLSAVQAHGGYHSAPNNTNNNNANNSGYIPQHNSEGYSDKNYSPPVNSTLPVRTPQPGGFQSSDSGAPRPGDNNYTAI